RPVTFLVPTHGPGRSPVVRLRGVRKPGDPRPAGRAGALPGNSGGDPHRATRPHSGCSRAPPLRNDSPTVDEAADRGQRAVGGGAASVRPGPRRGGVLPAHRAGG